MATNSPKKTERVTPKSYSICLLYNTIEAHKKLSGISLASCNSSGKSKPQTFENPGMAILEVHMGSGQQCMAILKAHVVSGHPGNLSFEYCIMRQINAALYVYVHNGLNNW